MAHMNVFRFAARPAAQIGLTLVLLFAGGCASLVNRAAFHPDRTHLIPVEQLPADVHPAVIGTEDNLRIAAYFLPCADADRLLIFFHGNAGNLGFNLPALMQLRSLGVSVLGVEYRGYGRSEGRPTERGIYADGNAAIEYAVTTFGVAPENIIVMGRSLGATVALNTARRRDIGGLILVTPLTTAREIARAGGMGIVSSLAGSALDNLSRCPDVRCPALVIHGTADSVIPLEMGRRIYDALPTPKQIVEIPGGDHNDLEYIAPRLYWESIGQFIRIPSPQRPS